MLVDMGTNVRAILYQHALSRAGLDSTPLRDRLADLSPIINQVIDHSWLNEVDIEQVKEYIGDHPALAENYLSQEGSDSCFGMWLGARLL